MLKASSQAVLLILVNESKVIIVQIQVSEWLKDKRLNVRRCLHKHATTFQRFTQTGQCHGGQMNGTHGVWSLAQSSDKLEVEDPTDQPADAARWE